MPDFLKADRLQVVPPGRPLTGWIRPPGSKSITNRLLLLASLAQGKSKLTGALKSDDTHYMAQALSAMGILISEPDATSFVIESDGQLHKPAHDLFLGNAGTATRFLTAAAALVPGQVVLDGDAHMRKRPIAPLLHALGQLGVEAHAPTNCPPVSIMGHPSLAGGRVSIDAGLSSQYVSAILMIGPKTQSGIDLALLGDNIGARGYVDLTLAAMAQFGAKAIPQGPGQWHVPPGQYVSADIQVEPDASAATYLWAAAALTGGAIDLGMAAAAFTQPDAMASALISLYPNLPPVIDGSQIQDAVPTLALVAAFCRNPVRFVGIANLRVKECDRIRALSLGLNAIAPDLAREDGDDLIIYGKPDLIGRRVDVRIDTFQDHRIAMSFALAGLLIPGIWIADPGCVAKTYPGFWDDLARLGVGLIAGPD
jgi:3-phosphoshikimate 1-carboxyvinyltransferase